MCPEVEDDAEEDEADDEEDEVRLAWAGFIVKSSCSIRDAVADAFQKRIESHIKEGSKYDILLEHHDFFKSAHQEDQNEYPHTC